MLVEVQRSDRYCEPTFVKNKSGEIELKMEQCGHGYFCES